MLKKGTYGQTTHHEDRNESRQSAKTQDSAYNLTVTWTASGGNNDGPVSLGGTVIGNLADLNNSANTTPLFAWWNATNHKLYVVDDNGYEYGSPVHQELPLKQPGEKRNEESDSRVVKVVNVIA